MCSCGNRTRIKSRSNSGQAAIEYILLIAITIAVILLFKEFYKQAIAPKLNYAMGGYIECLLETGQLPSFGDSTARQNFAIATRGDSKCQIAAGSFAGLTGGNTGSTNSGASGGTSGSGSSGGSSSGGGNSGSSGSSGGLSGNSSSGGSSGSSAGNSGTGPSKVSNYSGSKNSGYNSSSSGYSSYGQSGGASGEDREDPTRRKKSSPIGYAKERRQTYAIRDANGLTGTDGAINPNESEKKQIENGNIDEMGDEYGRGGRRGRSGSRYRGISGSMAQTYEKELEGKPRIASTPGRKRLPQSDGVTDGKAEARRRVDPPPPVRRSGAAVEVGDEGFSFGNIFKYLLIAGIVIAIIVFFGGQVMNYNNSQEK